MSKTKVKMTFKGDLPSFVIADSTLELKIEDLKKVLEGKRIVSDEIQLMEGTDASWQVFSLLKLKVGKHNNFSRTLTVKNGVSPGETVFLAEIDEFPEELGSSSRAEFSVSCEGQGEVVAESDNTGRSDCSGSDVSFAIFAIRILRWKSFPRITR